MNTRQIGSFLIVAGVLSGCASSHQSYPAASPPGAYPDSVVRDSQGDWVLRGDGTLTSPHRWEWVPRARASSPAPEAPFARR